MAERLVRVRQALQRSAVQVFQSPVEERLPTLLLRPRARLAALKPEALWDWAHLSEGEAPESGSETLRGIAAHLPRLHWPSIALVVPGEDTLVLDLQLPPGAERQGAAAAPFLVEDCLLEDIEAVHVALARTGAGSVRRAVAINAQCLAQTLAELAAAAGSRQPCGRRHGLLHPTGRHAQPLLVGWLPVQVGCPAQQLGQRPLQHQPLGP